MNQRPSSRQEEFHDVVFEREEHQEHHDHDTDVGGDGARPRRGRPALEQLDGEDQQQANVKNRDGQEVEQADVDAELGHEPQVLGQPLLGGDTRGVADGQGSTQRLW